MRTLIYGTLLALSTVAYAEKPAVCNSTTLPDARRATLCKEAPNAPMNPVGELNEPPWFCDKRYANNRVLETKRAEACQLPEEALPDVANLTFIDPRCKNEIYFSLTPAARRQIDCNVKHLEDFDLICQDYLTGKISMPDDMRTRYCPDVPTISSKKSTHVIMERQRLDWIKTEAQQTYDVGYRDGYNKRNLEDALQALGDALSDD